MFLLPSFPLPKHETHLILQGKATKMANISWPQCYWVWLISSVQFTCSVVSDSLQSHGLKYGRPLYPSPTPKVSSSSCPFSQWCHPTISSSVVPFSSPRPSIRVFSNESVFTSGGQSIVVSASASALPLNTQDWSPLGWTGWISLQSKGLSRVLSITTIQQHQFLSAQLSSQSSSHIHTWLLEKP